MLAVDYQPSSERDEVAVTWPHAVNIDVLMRGWVNANRAFRACGVVDEGPVTLQVFVGRECMNASVGLAEVPAMVLELSAKKAVEFGHVDCIEADLEGVSWYLDVSAFLGAEHQIRASFDGRRLAADWQEPLAELIASTAAVQARGGTSIYRQVLARITETLPPRRSDT